MTSQDRDYEELIRGALCAAADSIEPVGDGLQKIRHRLNSPRSARSLAAGFIDGLLLHRIRLSVRLEPVIGAGRLVRGQLAQTFNGPGSSGRRARRRRHGRPGPAQGWLGALGPWLRPVLAVSSVVAVVLIGYFALTNEAPTLLTPTNSVTSPNGGQSGTLPDTVTSPGLWQPPLGVNPSQPVTGTSHKKAVSSAPVVACTPTASPGASKAAPTPTASASSPAPTPSPSDTSSAAPTPTSTGTGGGPSGSPSPTDTTATTGATSAATTALVTGPDIAPGMAAVPCGGVVTPKAS